MKNPATTLDLLKALWPEAFQTEESAKSHPAREAKRLGTSPPADAMRAVSRHASETLPRLRRLAEARGMERSKALAALGEVLSLARCVGSDLVLTSEKSYRATLLGIHHGIGLFALLEDAAVATDDQELTDFCAALVLERRRLVAAAEEALAWFVERPDAARARAGAKVTSAKAAAPSA